MGGSTVSPLSLPPRTAILDTPISVTSYAEVLQCIERRPEDSAILVAFCNVHSVMTARRDPTFMAALEGIQLTCPDGVPLVWALRAMGHRGQQRVYGPDCMVHALGFGVPLGWRHYLYGATPDTLERLHAAAARIAPGVRIVGMHSPPFRPLTQVERAEIIEDIRARKPDVVWIGLGMPKQEQWAAEVRDELPGVALMAVGAAFDLLSGTVKQAPDFIQRAGLEWAYRLSREPRRLWRRYLWNNPMFLVLIAGQIIRHHRERRRLIMTGRRRRRRQ